MKPSYRRALIICLACACSTALPATIALAGAGAGADGVAVGSVAISLQIKQQCQINSATSSATTATTAPVVACDFDQPYETLLSNDEADATPLTSESAVATVTNAQTANRAKFWTVVF